jgi:hypothetical protein
MGLNDAGVPGRNLPAGEDHVMRRLADLERAYRELVASTAVRPGSLGNDALTSPVVPQGVYFTNGSFALTTTPTVISTRTITVPSGFTTAVVSVIGRLYAVNPNAGGDWLYARTLISGFVNVQLPLWVPASGFSGFNVSPFSQVLTGLTPGGTFAIALEGHTAAAGWALDLSNTTEVSGTINWLH